MPADLVALEALVAEVVSRISWWAVMVVLVEEES